MIIPCLVTAALLVPPSDTVVRPAGIHEIIDYMEEEMPVFPGGEKAFAAYLEKHLKYPAAAAKAQISGTVFIQFTVGKTGRISNVRPVGRYKGYGLEAEAIRVVCCMPRWKPAKMGGRYVSVIFNLPIRFTIPGQAKDPLTKHPYIIPPSN